ncbi:MAG: hypothetical protein H0U72_05855 [Nitrosospira sp.]|nr:hypothetical protein [Nitrosospira sp.]
MSIHVFLGVNALREKICIKAPWSVEVFRNSGKTCKEPVRVHACLASHAERGLNIKVVGCRVQEEHMNVTGNGQLRSPVAVTGSIGKPRQGRQ